MSSLRLNEYEARLLGVLIEKQLTTPDAYPLSLNALRAGANQKSNRDPAVSWSEAEVRVAVDGLVAKGLADPLLPGHGSRVERWEHQAGARLSLDRAELSVLCELLVRGPQAPGELRTRTSRMHEFPSLAPLADTLAKLEKRHLAKRLPPSPGSRSERWRELLSWGTEVGELAPAGAIAGAEPPAPASTTHASTAHAPAPDAPAPAPAPALAARLAALEARVATLERELGLAEPS